MTTEVINRWIIGTGVSRYGSTSNTMIVHPLRARLLFVLRRVVRGTLEGEIYSSTADKWATRCCK